MMRRWLAGPAAVLMVGAGMAASAAIGVPAASADTIVGQCTVVSNPTPTDHSMCAGDDLGLVGGGFNFDYADLDHTTIGAGSNVSSSTFVDANLIDGAWFHVGLISTDFTGATLDGINLGSGLETSATFTGAHITGANLTNGVWGGATFADADLTGTDFTGGQFGTGSSLTDFTAATLTGTTFNRTALVPSNQTATATSAAGANVSWPAPQSETGEALGACHDTAGPVSSGDVFPIGTTTVTCDVVDTANNTFGTGTFTVTVTGIAPAITSADATTFTVGQSGSFTVTANGFPAPTITESGTLPSGVTFANDVLAGTPLPGSAGTYDLIFTASNGVSPDATQSLILTVDQAAQSITFANPGSQVFGTSRTLVATASSGLPVTFTSTTPTICSVTPSGVLTAGAVGTCTVDANQAGNADYAAAAQVAQSFAITKAAQSITFANPGSQAFGTSRTLVATASSGLAVTFTSTTPTICSVTPSGMLTAVAVGTCTIDANQAGNADYAAAAQVQQSFAINKVAPPPPPATVPSQSGGPPLAALPSGGGYWVVSPTGILNAYGSAVFYGSMQGHPLNAPIVGIAATPDGKGYWLVAADGGVFSFGDARFSGSMGGRHLNQPVVGIAATPDGKGYWLVAADGGVFSFGDARFSGSMGGRTLNKPIVDMAADPSGGYWLVATDGGVFSFGGAPFFGSTGGRHLNRPVVGIATTPDGHGYWLVAQDGGVFNYGDAGFYGSEGGSPANNVIGLFSTSAGSAYTIVAADGVARTF